MTNTCPPSAPPGTGPSPKDAAAPLGAWAGLLTLGLGAAAYARWEAGQFTLRRHTLPLLPAGAGPFRIMHLSDIHMNPRDRKKGQWLQSLAAHRPDLVINTGDNLNDPRGMGPLLEALKPLLASPGVFVPGSHDYHHKRFTNPFAYFKPRRGRTDEGEPVDTAALHGAFGQAGWINMANRSQSLCLSGLRWDFTGVDDPHMGLDHFAGWPHGSATEDTAPHVRIALAHAPYQRVLDAYTRTGAQLIFAGHTHGGQVCVPGYGALVSNCDLPTWRARGLTTWEYGGRRSHLCVSAGIGTSPSAPWRVACRPEAVLLTLVPANLR